MSSDKFTASLQFICNQLYVKTHYIQRLNVYTPVTYKIACKKLYVLVIYFDSNYIKRGGYIAIDKQFDGFNLKQKRISSTAVMLGEWEILTIYKTYIKTYQKLLVTYQKMSLSFAYTTKQAQVKKRTPIFLWSHQKIIYLLIASAKQKLITSSKLAHYQKENLDIIPQFS